MESVKQHLDAYLSGPLGHYVRSHQVLADAASMILARQPAGDMSDPPVEQYALCEMLSPGIRHQSDVGGGRFVETPAVGELLLIAPRFATSIYVHAPHTIRILAFQPALVESAREDGSLSASAGDLGLLHRGSVASQPIRHALNCIWELASRDDSSARLLSESALQFVASELLRIAGRARPVRVGGLAPWQIRRATEAIAARLDGSMSLAELAELVGLSPFHFCRSFRKSLGVTPHRYQVMRRIDRARDLLESSSASVTDVALAVGYQSSQALAREFKKETGRTPLAYRRAFKA